MGLVAFAVGLDAGAVLEVLVDDAPLLGAHLVHLDGAVALEGPLGSAIGPGDEDLAPALPVARGIEDDPLALAHTPEGSLVAEQLQRVDRLAAFADQEPVVVVAVDDDVDAVVSLADLNLTFKVKLVEALLDELPHSLGRLRRPIPVSIAHSPILSTARGSWRGIPYRLFFFFRGGGGGGFAAAA